MKPERDYFNSCSHTIQRVVGVRRDLDRQRIILELNSGKCISFTADDADKEVDFDDNQQLADLLDVFIIVRMLADGTYSATMAPFLGKD